MREDALPMRVKVFILKEARSAVSKDEAAVLKML
jgi:hypothetical protein